jgi:type VI secretion system protein ImpM
MPVEPVTGAADTGLREAPGWYGKISTLGDFAQRRLPAEFVQASDAWLSRTMVASRQQLGERWLEGYLTSPVMRFAWAPGVVAGAGPHWWFGVLMPSCDSVGRYFPLLIAQRRTRPPLDRIALDHLELWFAHLANAATHTLGERATVEGFEQALGEAPPWPSAAAVAALSTLAPCAAPGGVSYAFGHRVSMSQWLHAIALDELHARFAGCSIWWRQGDATRDTEAEVVKGLPEPTAFAQMLTG